MQNKLVNLANEAIAINTGLYTKSVANSVEAGQKFVQQVSEHTIDTLNVKDFDGLVSNQKGWAALAAEQTQEVAQSMINLGNEAYDAYALLWKKAFAPVVELTEAKVVKAKAA